MIDTTRGSFQSFATLRHAYLKAHDDRPLVGKYFREGGWVPTKLHISELGKCPRQQMLRIKGTKPKPRSQSKEANDALMFWQGNMIHALTVGACEWAEILSSYEEPLPDLPELWRGHYDLIWWSGEEKVLWDGKTVRPNAFDYWYEWPKPEVTAQIRGYLAHLPGVGHGEVEYIDRGGSNTPQVFPIARHNGSVFETMVQLEGWYHMLLESPDALPPILPRIYKATYRKVRNEPLHLVAGVWWQPSWQCEWCDFVYGIKDKRSGEWTVDPSSPCKPDLRPKLQVAKTIEKTMTLLEPKHEREVEACLASALPAWEDPEDEPSTEE